MNSDSKVTIKLDGELGLRDVETIKDRFLEALGVAKAIHVDTRDLMDIDVSTIQILIAAQKSAAQKGIAYSLATPVDGVLAQTLKRGGFVPDASPDRVPVSRSE